MKKNQPSPYTKTLDNGEFFRPSKLNKKSLIFKQNNYLSSTFHAVEAMMDPRLMGFYLVH